MALMFAALGPALPLVAGHYGGAMTAQAVMTMPGIGVVAGGAIGGLIIDRLGIRPTLYLALLIYALAGATGLAAPVLWALLAARFLLGLAVAHVSNCCLTLLGGWFDEASRARILGYQAAVAGAVSVTLLLAGGQLAEVGGWRAPFSLYLLALPVLGLALLAIPRTAAPPVMATRTDWAAIVALWPIYLLVGGLFLAYFMTSVQLTFLLAGDGVASPVTRSIVIGTGVASGGVFGGLFGPIRRLAGQRRTRLLLIGLMAAGFALIGLSHNVVLIAVGAVLCGGGGGLINPYVSGLMLARAPLAMRSKALGFMFMTFYLADFLNPWAVYPFRAAFGIHGAFLAAAGFLALGMVASWRVGASKQAALAGLIALFIAGPAGADAPAATGAAIYAERCATCHGSVLRGGGAPPLAGPTFQARWNGKPAADLYRLIATTMPLNAVGGLTPAEYRAVTDFVMAGNGYLPANPVLKVDPAAKPAEAPDPVLPAAATLIGKSIGTAPDDADIAHPSDEDWPTYNRDYLGQRFSALKQITTANVNRLAPTCIFQTGDIGSFEASPVVWRGRLYVTTTHSTFAIDAASCKELWRHTYTPPGAEGLPVNRGVALYRGKVLRGTPDGHVVALDAETGKLLWDVWVANSLHGYNINGAVAAFGGKVFTGQGGADRGATGHIYAFDVETGKLAWTFDPVPTGKQPGAESWAKGTEQGGGSSWTSITVDPRTRQLYIPVGNPGADMDGDLRPGNNLYTDSVVVLNADTGKLDWYIQQIPHDTHDWDTAAAPALYEIGGRKFMAVASKDGWLYLYDRDTKELLAKSEIDTHLNADKPLLPGVEMRVCPGTLGGAEWNGPAYDPVNRMLFINSVDWCGGFNRQTAPGSTFGGSLKFDPIEQVTGWVHCFDAVTGAQKWVRHTDGPMVAGVTPTAGGLVFTGTPSGAFWGLDARTGDILYEFQTGGAIGGGISSYAVSGRQYIAVASGSASKTIWKTAGAPTLIIFALPVEH
jgi:PQQ-dependent dehydrogenase (methanol/ethanol family)